MGHSDYDQFDDFLQGNGALREGGGILDSPGLHDYEGIQTKVEADGLHVILNCRFCNKKRQVVLEWPELVILGENSQGGAPILPRGWVFSENNGTAFVKLPCPNCGNAGFAVHMTPEEAREKVGNALKAGLVSQAQVVQLQQQVRNQRGG